jgi:hypothetical protein
MILKKPIMHLKWTILYTCTWVSGAFGDGQITCLPQKNQQTEKPWAQTKQHCMIIVWNIIIIYSFC